MRTFMRDDHAIRLGLLGLILALLYLTVAIPLGFFEGLRLSSADFLCSLKNSIQGPPPQLQQLLLVVVDDESQRHLNQKWPWDRALFAQFLQKVTPLKPKLVLFDFAFLGKSPPESDAALAQAIREGLPVLLAAYLDPKGELMLPDPQFTQAGGVAGLINKPMDRDLVLRRLWAKVQLPGVPEPLEGIELKAAAQMLGELPKKIPLGRLGELPINYLAKPEHLPTLSFWKVLQGEVNPDQIRDKLIIVGSTREITHDVHPTPLGRMPGMAIEANGILTLLTQRYVKSFPLWAVLPMTVFFVVGILLVGFYSKAIPGFLVTVALTAAAAAGSFILALQDYSVEIFGIFALGATAWLIGILYKYAQLLAETLRLQHQAVMDPFTGCLSARYFHLRLSEELKRCRLLGRPMALFIVQMAPTAQLLQKITWEDLRRQLKQWVAATQKMLPSHATIGRLQENRFGILVSRTRDSRIQEIARQLEASLKSSPGLEFSLKSYDPAIHKIPLEELPGGLPLSDREGDLSVVASELEEKEKALEKALADLRAAHREMEASFLEVTKSLVLALETKDAYTAGHLERVSRYATRLAQELQLPTEEVEAIREAALLHDIGKIGLPDEVLHKVGALTEEEKKIIQEHLAIGAKILEPMKFFRPITTLIYHHHERYDGKGYPHGLSGEFIPSGAQVIAIVDSFDAMTTHRGYNKPKTVQEAVEELRRGAGTQFNPLYVDKFSQIMSREGPHLAGYETPT